MKIKSLIVAMLLLSTQVFAERPDEVMPVTLNIDSSALQLNGIGTRNKFFFDLYDAGLYLMQPGQEASSIIEVDEPMMIRLVITSALISSERMQEATLEGFEKSTHGQSQLIRSEINQFIEAFDEEIVENDRFDLLYQPGIGVRVMKNDVSKTVISGLAFKRALFGIWLSDDPVQTSLKEGLLGIE